jgi:hypothetical protein
MMNNRADKGWTWIERVAQDVRYAGRLLARRPAFSVTAILTLTLGIGGSTAVFSPLHALLIKNLPVERPEALGLPAALVVTRLVSSMLFRDESARPPQHWGCANRAGHRHAVCRIRAGATCRTHRPDCRVAGGVMRRFEADRRGQACSLERASRLCSG